MKSIKIWDFWADKYERLWVQKYSLSPTRREIIKELKDIIKEDRAYRILDMGCGTGQLIRDMKKEFSGFNIKFTGVDISSKMIEVAKEKNKEADYLNYSIEEFKEQASSFDIIVCTHSFPYYSNKEEAINKFHYLLKEEGYLFLAQASANSLYDNIIMFFVKFTTSSAKYLSIKNIRNLTREKFHMLKINNIKEKCFMPTITLFILKKDGNN
jgi:2-polyprenyl-3-methyl-5-hydroxy-6-metoxy-1,4-benzoquinol methylase